MLDERLEGVVGASLPCASNQGRLFGTEGEKRCQALIDESTISEIRFF